MTLSPHRTAALALLVIGMLFGSTSPAAAQAKKKDKQERRRGKGMMPRVIQAGHLRGSQVRADLQACWQGDGGDAKAPIQRALRKERQWLAEYAERLKSMRQELRTRVRKLSRNEKVTTECTRGEATMNPVLLPAYNAMKRATAFVIGYQKGLGGAALPGAEEDAADAGDAEASEDPVALPEETAPEAPAEEAASLNQLGSGGDVSQD